MAGVKGRSGGHNRKSDTVRRREGNPGHRPLRGMPPSRSHERRYGPCDARPDDDGSDQQCQFLNMQCPWPYEDQRHVLWTKLHLAVPVEFWNGAAEAMLEMATRTWVSYRQAAEQADLQGAIIIDHNGMARRNPAVIVARGAIADFIRATAALGIGSNKRSQLMQSGTTPIDWISLTEEAEQRVFGPLPDELH